MKLIPSILFLVIAASAGIFYAQAQEKGELRQMMGPNFEMMNRMLFHILVDENYEEVVEGAKLISRHAQMIREHGPNKDMPDQSYFLNFANFLEAHATGLQVVAETIQAEERLDAERSVHLRPQAAMHYGQIVTMCVSCHNRYRQRSPLRK